MNYLFKVVVLVVLKALSGVYLPYGIKRFYTLYGDKHKDVSRRVCVRGRVC